MRSSLFAAAAAVSSSALASAGVVSVPFSRSNGFDKLGEIAKRDGTLSLSAVNNITGGGYYAEFEIGTPGQKLTFIIDTGSSDTWANSVTASLCSDVKEEEQVGFCLAQFNSNASSTYKLVDQGGFNITYLSGVNILGDYFTDTLTIGSSKITDQQLGLATDSEQPTGIMGLGFRINEAAQQTYPTVIDNMVSQGIINSPAFSLYLDDVNDNTGIVLFGGVDKDKFTDDLVSLPMISGFESNSENVTSYTVQLEGFDVTVPSGAASISMPSTSASAVLDSGSTYCLLPSNAANTLMEAFNVVTIQELGTTPFIDCAYAGSKGNGYTLDFKFNGKTINVPMSEIVIDVLPQAFQQEIEKSGGPTFSNWTGVCMFGIGSVSDYGVQSDNFAVLGDTFLRSAYVVYDLANNEIGMAQANLNSSSSSIEEFSANSSSIPSASGVASSGSSAPSTAQAAQTSTSATATAASTTGGEATTATTTGTDVTNTATDSNDGSDSGAGHLVSPFNGGAVGVAGITLIMMTVGTAFFL